MLSTKPRPLFFTLLTCLFITVALISTADAKHSPQTPAHANLRRLIKKRSPFPADDLPILSLSSSSSSSSTSATGTASGTLASLSASSTASSSASSSLSSSSSSVSSSTSSKSTSTSTSSTSTSTTATSVNAPETTDTLNLTFANDPTKSKATVTQTQVNTPTSDIQAQSAAANDGSKGKTLTILIVVASSIAGVVILWTIFRKWKLGRTDKTEKRLRPIDWQPSGPEEDIIPGHRRANSNASSFYSAGHSGRGAAGYGSSDGHVNALAPLPDHDFTAAANLAPVGGYADLARGPSPQPSMQEALSRGPSLTRPGYDVGVPLHHQTGYNDAYDQRRY